jgi:transcriptional regulator with GAF, ATPase, and Fis domain
VVQDGEFERLGSTRTVRTDARLIAATNRDLKAALDEGRFRPDLYYRISVFPITVPPLRERTDDIPKLVWHFVRLLGDRMGKQIQTIAKKDMALLKAHPWPGNVRQLANVIEHAMILSQGVQLNVQIPADDAPPRDGEGSLADVERDHILKVLERTSGRVRGLLGAAEILGLKPTTLESRIKKMGIDRKKLRLLKP